MLSTLLCLLIFSTLFFSTLLSSFFLTRILVVPGYQTNSKQGAFLNKAISVLITLVSLTLFQVSTAFGSSSASQQNEANNLISCECVAFRFDDVQDYYLSEAQMGVIDTFERNNASLTIGIIGNFFGKDPTVLAFLNEKISHSAANGNNPNSFSLEAANHGWNHEDFTTFSRDEQTTMMRDTNKKIVETIGLTPKVFIAPYNRLNDDTISAARDNGLYYVSGNTRAYPATYLSDIINSTSSATSVEEKRVYHFPSAGETGDLNSDDTEWVGSSHEETFKQIEKELADYGYAVVTMHPQEFSMREGVKYENRLDEGQLAQLQFLLDDIRTANLRIVQLSQIGSSSSVPEFAFAIPVTAGGLIAVYLFSTYTRRKNDYLNGP
jgi:peptidoglycan/xylan/chitin deacetylase (PgdA/CDA1 family)